MKLYNSIALNYDNDENDHGSFGVGNIDFFFFSRIKLKSFDSTKLAAL